jgi:peptidoglycan/xylan/chitin deacetylase (PgdA/CDA1 family)
MKSLGMKGSLKSLLLGAARTAGGRSSANLGALVLCHHGVDDSGNPFTVSEKTFKSQMTYLFENGASWMTVAELGRALSARSLPPRAVCMTFDDGLPSTFEPISWLLESGGKCTQFVVTSRVQEAEKLGEDSAKSLGWSRLKALANMGVEIGSHTISHPDLTRLSASELRRELVEPKALLEEQLGRPVESLAYPFGLVNAGAVAAAGAAGYRWACTTQHVHASPAFNPLTTPRFECGHLHDLAETFDGRGWIFYAGLQAFFLIRNRLVLG